MPSAAHRHREPVTVLCLEVDQLSTLARACGTDVAEAKVGRLAEAAAPSLRGSDFVARLDDGRVVIVLPDTPRAARADRRRGGRAAMALLCGPGPDTPTALTVSMGVASFPDDATEMTALFTPPTTR